MRGEQRQAGGNKIEIRPAGEKRKGRTKRGRNLGYHENSVEMLLSEGKKEINTGMSHEMNTFKGHRRNRKEEEKRNCSKWRGNYNNYKKSSCRLTGRHDEGSKERNDFSNIAETRGGIAASVRSSRDDVIQELQIYSREKNTSKPGIDVDAARGKIEKRKHLTGLKKGRR